MKKIILCLLTILLLVGCTKNKNEENNKVNITSDELEKTVLNEGISIKIDKFYYTDGYTTINLLITNNNDYDVYIGKYEVLVYDKNHNLLGIFTPIFDDNLESKTETNQMFSMEGDLSEAFSIEYKFNELRKV